MWRNDARESDQLAAASFAQVVIVEVLQLISAHVQRRVRSVIQRNELAITAGNFELANNEGGSISRVSLNGGQLHDQ